LVRLIGQFYRQNVQKMKNIQIAEHVVVKDVTNWAEE
jgi:hypothetical protein